MTTYKTGDGMLVQGLHVLHSCQLIHLDLKLDNVRVSMDADGSCLHLTILDLGSARANGVSKSCKPALLNLLLSTKWS